jgi:hypothetical protein
MKSGAELVLLRLNVGSEIKQWKQLSAQPHFANHCKCRSHSANVLLKVHTDSRISHLPSPILNSLTQAYYSVSLKHMFCLSSQRRTRSICIKPQWVPNSNNVLSSDHRGGAEVFAQLTNLAPKSPPKLLQNLQLLDAQSLHPFPFPLKSNQRRHLKLLTIGFHPSAQRQPDSRHQSPSRAPQRRRPRAHRPTARRCRFHLPSVGRAT